MSKNKKEDTNDAKGVSSENEKILDNDQSKSESHVTIKEEDLAPIKEDKSIQVPKTMGNTDQNAAKENVKDMVTFGGDLFKLMSKASSQSEGWMKSTKGMAVRGVGVMIQVTTQQRNHDGSYTVAEALSMAHGCTLKEVVDGKGKVTGRHLESR